MTFNAWCDHPAHPDWEKRRAACASVFRETTADVVAGQEFTSRMLDDLSRDLEQYRWIGAGRDDGDRAGEFTPVFYRPDRLELSRHGTFWLAPDPSTVGLGWNARCHRTTTWAEFRDHETGRPFLFASTHFDHRGGLARTQSARLLRTHLPALSNGIPSILAGDFNCRPSSRPYRVLSEAWQDARHATRTPPRGPARTWRGWSRLGLGAARIDHVFVSPRIPVLEYRVWDTPAVRLASDHRPVTARLRL